MLSLSKKVFIVGVFIIFGCLNPGYAWGPSKTKLPKPKPGKIMERIVVDGRRFLSPVSGALITVQLNNFSVKATSSSSGEYLINLSPSSWFRFGTISAYRIGFQEQSSFLVIPPWTRIINRNFTLKDNQAPILKITSPVDGEEISTTPVIKLSYVDSGSGINTNSIRIRAAGKEVTQYITFRNQQQTVCTVPPGDPLPKGYAWIEAYVTDFAGNIKSEDVFVKLIDMGNYYLERGKEALLKQDALGASTYFNKALEETPENLEARFYSGLMRVALIPRQNEVFAMLANMGFKGPKGIPLTKEHVNALNLLCEPPIDIEQFKLVDTFPNGQKIQEIIKNNIISAIEQTVEDWNIVLKNKHFASDLEITNPLTGTEKIWIDYGDVAIFKSMLLGFESKLSELLVRDADADLVQLSARYFKGGLTPEYVLETYPDLLRVKDEEIPTSLTARDTLVAAIDSYKEGSDFILAATGDRSDHLLSISSAPQYREQAVLFGEQLEDVKKSLLGSSDTNFSLKLSQMLNLGRFFTNPFDLRRLLDNDSATYLMNSILPNLEYAGQNFSKATVDYQEFLPPDSFHYRGKKWEVDFADVAAARNGIEAMRMALLGASAYDLKGDVQSIGLEAWHGKRFTVQEILDKYPHLFYLNDSSFIDEAQKAFLNLEKAYAQGSNYLLNQEDVYQSDDVLVMTYYFKNNARRYRTMFEHAITMQEVLIDPRTEIQSDEFQLNLGNFFLRYPDARPFLPRFDESGKIIPNTWPDESFGGIFPEHKF